MSIVSRRAALVAGAGTLGLLALGFEAPSAVAATASLPARSQYGHFLGKTFTATRGSEVYQLRLIRISNVAGTTAKQRELSFLLVFAMVGSVTMPDGIFNVRRLGVPAHSLFLSGIGSPRSMQALMNRSV